MLIFSKRGARARQRGLTLVELLATITVGATISALALPNLGSMVMNSRRTALVNELVGAIQLARTEAAIRGRTVVICPSADGASCGRAADWNRGWIVFVNLDGDASARDPQREPLLQVYATDPRQSIGVNLAGGGDAVQLRPFDTRSSNGTITICDARGAAAARAVVIGVMGRPYAASTDGSHHALTCPQAA
jgi:type IV fimbrial biogenesis protein FimT